jgi:hypothetical protein
VERSERIAFDAQAFKNKVQARQHNVSRAEGFIRVSKGKRFYRNGVGQPRRGENGKR